MRAKNRRDREQSEYYPEEDGIQGEHAHEEHMVDHHEDHHEEHMGYAPTASLPGPGLFLIPGVALLGGSFVFGLLALKSPSTQSFIQSVGLSPGLLGLLGTALIAGALVLRGLKASAQRVQHLEEQTRALAEQNEVIRTGLADLGSIDVAAKLAQVASGMAPSEIQSALVNNDEKLNNLTKATRILSKPIEDLSKISNNLMDAIKTLETSLKDASETSETHLSSLEEDIKSLPSLVADLSTKKVEEILTKVIPAGVAPIQENLQENFDEIGESLAGLRIGLKDEVSQGVDLIAAQLKSLPKPTESEGTNYAAEESIRELTNMVRSMESKVNDISLMPAPAMASSESNSLRDPKPAPQQAPPPRPSPQQSKKGKVSVLSSIEKLKQMRGK